MRSDFMLALQQIADEKGIQIDSVIGALRSAVISAFEDFNTEYDDIDKKGVTVIAKAYTFIEGHTGAVSSVGTKVNYQGRCKENQAR